MPTGVHNGHHSLVRAGLWIDTEPGGIMIQRLIGVIVGGIVTFLLLLLFHNGRIISDEWTGFLVSVVVGAVVNLFWPLIWSTVMARRNRDYEQSRVRAEVQLQVDAQCVVEPELPPDE